MRVYKRGAVFWASYRDSDGKQRRVSTRAGDRTAAEAIARELERDAADPTYRASKGERLAEALERVYREKRLLGRSEATLSMAAGKAAALLKHFQDATLQDVSPRTVDIYLAERRRQGISEHTLVKELGLLSQALRLAVRAGTWTGKPEAVLPVIRSTGVYVPRRRYLTREQADAVLDRLPPHRQAHIAFILATGARLGESRRAQRNDIHNGLVNIRGTKTAEALRTVPLLPMHVPYIQLALKFAPGKTVLFKSWLTPNMVLMLKRACKAVDIPPVTANDLRRTYGTWLYQAGVPPYLIARAMGHTTSAITERVYTRMTPQVLGQLMADACTASVPNKDEPLITGDNGYAPETLTFLDEFE